MASALGGGGVKPGSSAGFPSPPSQEQLAGLTEQDFALRRQTADENAIRANFNIRGPFGNSDFTFGPDGQGTLTNTALPGIDKLIRGGIQQAGQFQDLQKQNFLGSDQLFRDPLDQEFVNENVSFAGGGNLPDIPVSFNRGAGLDRFDFENDLPALLDAINLTGVPGIPGIDEFRDQGQAASDAVFNQFARRFDPQNELDANRLAQNLANRGLPVGGGAQTEALRGFRQDTATARLDAADRAELTGQQVQSEKFQNFLRGQGQAFGQAQAQGQFTNASRIAQLAQTLSALGFNNQAAQAEEQLRFQGRETGFRDAQRTRNQALQEQGFFSGQGLSFLPQPPSPDPVGVTFGSPSSPLDIALALFQQQSQQAIGQQNAAAEGKGAGLGALGSLGAAGIGLFG